MSLPTQTNAPVLTLAATQTICLPRRDKKLRRHVVMIAVKRGYWPCWLRSGRGIWDPLLLPSSSLR